MKSGRLKKTLTVNQEKFIQDFFVLVIFMVFNFSFLYWNLQCKNAFSFFFGGGGGNSNKNYMTMKIS